MKRIVRNFLVDEAGQELTEYALLMVFVALGSFVLGRCWASYRHLGHLQ